MAARVGWLIFHLVSNAIAFFALIRMVNRPRGNHVFVIVLFAVFLVLSLLGTWRTLCAVIRYLRHPLQKSQQYLINGQPLEQFQIAPILVEGPCLLVLKSDLEMVAVAIGHMHLPNMSALRTSTYSHVGLDFQIPPGKWPLRLVIQLPGSVFRSFRLGLRHKGKSFAATLTLEVRGRPLFVQLPENIEEMTRAFPVLAGEAPPEPHHL